MTFVPKLEYSHRSIFDPVGYLPVLCQFPTCLRCLFYHCFLAPGIFHIFSLCFLFCVLSTPVAFQTFCYLPHVLKTMLWVSCSWNPSRVFIGHFLLPTFQYLQEWHEVALGIVNNFWWLSFLQILCVSKIELKNNLEAEFGNTDPRKWTDSFTWVRF